jgi:dihydrofolate reductase
MTKVVLSMSMSLDGIAGPGVPDADGMALFEEILGWVFPLRSWRAQQGMAGGEDSVDSQVWQATVDRFGPQVIGRQMFDYGYPNWGENPPFRAPVFVVTHRGQAKIDKEGGTSYTFVTGGLAEAVAQARAVAEGEGALHLRYEVR